MPQNATVTAISDLSESDAALWRRFQAADTGLKSPYFCLDYLKILDTVHPGVRVLRIDEAGTPIGFLPYRRDFLGTARPPDGPLGDLHGLIAAPETSVDLASAFKAVSLGGYNFAGVPYQQARHGLGGMAGAGNQTVDLSQGYKAYLEERASTSSSFRRMHRKVNDFLEAPGLSVTHETFDEAAFERLIQLKEAGYASAGHFDVFQLDWPAKMLRALARSEGGDVSGVFSVMRKDGALVAACFCMRSPSALHYWFPGYEKAYADQKPGHAMLFSLIEWADTRGISEVHLGPGNDQYKRQMATFAAPLRQGALVTGVRQKALANFHGWAARGEAAGSPVGAFSAKLSRKFERVAITGRLNA